VTMTIFTLTGFMGPNFWLQTLTIGGRTIKYNELTSIICLVGSIPTTLNSIKETVLFYLQKKEPRASTGTQAFLQLLPASSVIIFSILWFQNSPHLLAQHPHAICFSVGFAFCNLIGRLVLARVCKQDLSTVQPIVLPFIAGFVLFKFHLLPASYESLYLQASGFLAVAAYLHFALSVIDIICTHLKIRCLRIPYTKTA